jgi:hypothetical protein
MCIIHAVADSRSSLSINNNENIYFLWANMTVSWILKWKTIEHTNYHSENQKFVSIAPSQW